MKTILQISDPHLMSIADGRLKGVPTAKNLEMVIADARAHHPEADRIVMTGDLSHEHTQSGYEILASLLSDWTAKAQFLPGNHDDRATLRQVFATMERDGLEDIRFREEVDAWLLVGLDSHVPGEVFGRLSDASLKWLESVLNESPTRPTLIFLHHPPVKVGSQWIDALMLQNSADLDRVLSSAPGVRGIFSGHIHQERRASLGTIPFYSCPSTAFQFAPATTTRRFDNRPPGYRVILLGKTGEFQTHVRRLAHLAFPPTDKTSDTD